MVIHSTMNGTHNSDSFCFVYSSPHSTSLLPDKRILIQFPICTGWTSPEQLIKYSTQFRLSEVKMKILIFESMIGVLRRLCRHTKFHFSMFWGWCKWMEIEFTCLRNVNPFWPLEIEKENNTNIRFCLFIHLFAFAESIWNNFVRIKLAIDWFNICKYSEFCISFVDLVLM